MTKSDPMNPKKPNSLPILFAWFFGVLILFALNQFVFGKILEHSMGERTSQFTYVVIRVFAFIILARAMVLYAGRNRFQTLSTVLLAGFIDQVFIKGLWIKLNPAVYQDLQVPQVSDTTLLINLAFGYLFMIPVVLIFCFVGMESIRFKRDWKLGEGN